MRSRNPATTSSRILYGSSVRGLSFVTKTMSEYVSAISPISFRFDASRSPPHPKTVMTFRTLAARRLVIARFSASGVCA
eukprot:19313-Pelagococcus_subviridis.AAC.2